MLDEDSDDQKDGCNDDEPELMFQRMLFVMMLVFVRAGITMYVLVFVLVRMRMCHIFALFISFRLQRYGTFSATWLQTTYNTQKWYRPSAWEASWSRG